MVIRPYNWSTWVTAVISLACLALVRAPRRAIRPWLWAAIVFFLLALGPTLHVNGADTFHISGLHLRLPLPFALLGYLPVLPYLGGGTAIGLSALMVMLALIVLAGYGVKHLRWMVAPSWARLVSTALFAVIVLECAIIPFPLWQVSVPQVYQIIQRFGSYRRSRLTLWARYQDLSVRSDSSWQEAHPWLSTTAAQLQPDIWGEHRARSDAEKPESDPQRLARSLIS